jgi:tripartite-type tricarboxylate transporter receptor subunit TctC
MSMRILLAALLLVAGNASAQYPNRPLKMIVPFPPAGATDIVGRIVAAKLQERLGQPVVVENRPGAGGSLGSDVAAKSAPDGYTILMATSSTHSIGPVLQKLPYDPIKDFAPITHVANVPNVLVVSPKLPVRNLSDLVALAKSQPGKLNYASAGTGSITQLNIEKLKLIAKLDIVHVPYKGTQLSIPDLANGNVAMLFDSLASALPNIRSGNARPIALNAPARSALLPEVPTMAEAGMPEFDLYTWFGLFAPAGTPPEAVARIQREVAAGLKSPDVLERFAAVGAEPVGSTPAEFVERIRSDAASWAEVIRTANIKAQ